MEENLMPGTEISRTVQEWSAEQLRHYMLAHHPEDYYLIDVRQLPAYTGEHLPGALRIPAEDLPGRLATLDASKTTIVYCDEGALSHVAAQIMGKSGFHDVHVLEGGLQAWQHGTASGCPQQVCLPLFGAGDVKDQAMQAWSMEETARCFYQEMADTLEDLEVAALFAQLATAEKHHKTLLKELWEALAGQTAKETFSAGNFASELMEGGVRLEEALRWAAESRPAQIIDFAMAMELSAFDHYLYLQRNLTDPDSQRLFEVLADEERHHLKDLGKALDRLRQTS